MTRFELTVGEATLDLSEQEIAGLFRMLLEHADTQLSPSQSYAA